MNLFRIKIIGRNNMLLVIQGNILYNDREFTVYVSKHTSHNIFENTRINYLYSNDSYYIVSIINNHDIENININNFIWEEVNYNNNNFPYYSYGITDNLYQYIKGMII